VEIEGTINGSRSIVEEEEEQQQGVVELETGKPPQVPPVAAGGATGRAGRAA